MTHLRSISKPQNIVENNFIGLANYLTGLKVKFNESKLDDIFGTHIQIVEKNNESNPKEVTVIYTKYEKSLLDIDLIVADKEDKLDFKVNINPIEFIIKYGADGRANANVICPKKSVYITRDKLKVNDLKQIDDLYRSVIQEALGIAMTRLLSYNDSLYKLTCKNRKETEMKTKYIDIEF